MHTYISAHKITRTHAHIQSLSINRISLFSLPKSSKLQVNCPNVTFGGHSRGLNGSWIDLSASLAVYVESLIAVHDYSICQSWKMVVC